MGEKPGVQVSGICDVAGAAYMVDVGWCCNDNLNFLMPFFKRGDRAFRLNTQFRKGILKRRYPSFLV